MKNKFNSLFKIRFYKYFFGGQILFSKPIQCNKEDNFEVHILTCEKDYQDAIWCLKTFYYFSRMRPPLIIHDDGSLSGKSRRILAKHFLNSRIILREESDRKVKSYLKDYEYCIKYRYDSFMFHSIKLFDCLVFSGANGLLILDSDILFFNSPTELASCIKQRKGFFMGDYQNAYSFEKERLSQLFGFSLREKANTGIVFLPDKNIFDFNLVESFLREACHQNYPNKSWLEQTAFALIFSKYADKFRKLGSNYQISEQFISDQTVSHHFVTDGSRDRFYTEGLRTIKRKGFLKALRLNANSSGR